MTQQAIIMVSGTGSSTLAEQLDYQLKKVRPKAVSFASAFVSVAGTNKLAQILKNAGNPKCRLIAGISSSVTHPEALYNAVAWNWDLRLGETTTGIFHPKLAVAGEAHCANGNTELASVSYIGSGNLTHSGLCRNLEVGGFFTDSQIASLAANAFAELWSRATVPTEKKLNDYAESFAQKNLQRSIEELNALGIYDAEDSLEGTYSGVLRGNRPKQSALSARAARAAWTGAQSFTGGYMFQMEFPRAVGDIIAGFVKKRGPITAELPVYCRADHTVRKLQFGYYQNAMYRLNIPNDVPGVQSARATRLGIVVVWASDRSDAAIELEILHSGEAMDRLVSRSVALSSWGKTTTRAYGWF